MLAFFWICWTVQMTLLSVLAWQWLRVKRRSPPAPEPAFLPATLIVCLHNEEENLRQHLDSWACQRHPAYELLLVDDRSTDCTLTLLQEAAGRYPHVSVLSLAETPAGWSPKKWAVQSAVAVARHPVLAFTDADCKLPPDWLVTLTTPLAHGQEVVLGYSPYAYRPGLLNAIIRWDAFCIGAQYMGAAMAGYPYMAVGRCLAYHRSFFERAGGLHQHAHLLSGDDDLLINHNALPQSTAVALHPASFATSRPKETLGQLLRQKTRHISASSAYGLVSQLLLAAFSLTGVGVWGLALCIWLCHGQMADIIGGVAALFLLRTTYLLMAGKHLKSASMILFLPLLDALRAVLLGMVSAKAFVSSSVRWK